jgi:hypothetical protein
MVMFDVDFEETPKKIGFRSFVSWIDNQPQLVLDSRSKRPPVAFFRAMTTAPSRFEEKSDRRDDDRPG